MLVACLLALLVSSCGNWNEKFDEEATRDSFCLGLTSDYARLLDLQGSADGSESEARHLVGVFQLGEAFVEGAPGEMRGEAVGVRRLVVDGPDSEEERTRGLARFEALQASAWQDGTCKP